MELNDFKEEIEEQDTDTIKRKILTAIYDLAVQIAKHEGIEYNEKGCKYLLVKEIMEQMPNISYANDYYEILYNKLYNQEKIEEAIERYNRINNSWEYYLEDEREIKEKGYKNLLRIGQDKLTVLFHEMLDFKNKKYDKDWDFLTLLEYTSRYYNAFSHEFDEVYLGLKYHVVKDIYGEENIPIGEVENIQNIRYLYSELSSDYMARANDYIDIDLKENQTYKDLIREKKQEYEKLFKKMLDYVQISYKDKNFYQIQNLVCETYPWYEDMIHHALEHNSLHENNIDILDSLYKIYDKLKNYKKDYQNLKTEWDKEKKNDEKSDLDELEFIDIDEDEDILENIYDEEFLRKYQKEFE